MTDRPRHYAMMWVCQSFIAACAQDWCYNSGLWEALRTDDVKKVTCKKCLRQLNKWGWISDERFKTDAEHDHAPTTR